jgi:hypothetical protein
MARSLPAIVTRFFVMIHSFCESLGREWPVVPKAHERAGLVYAKNAIGDAAALGGPR